MPIVQIPDARLRAISSEISPTDPVAQIVADLSEALIERKGIGLAAIQIGIAKRVFIMKIDETCNISVFINPVLLGFSEEKGLYAEGCLSIPEAREDVERPLEIELSFMDADMVPRVAVLSGLEARCAQHELDHLNGILFIDYLSRLKRDKIVKRSMKLLRGY